MLTAPAAAPLGKAQTELACNRAAFSVNPRSTCGNQNAAFWLSVGHPEVNQRSPRVWTESLLQVASGEVTPSICQITRLRSTSGN